MPSTNISGTNTAIVVSVEATIAPETSFVPSLAADASVSVASAVVFSLAVPLLVPATSNFMAIDIFKHNNAVIY